MYSKEKFEAGYAANVKVGMAVKPHDDAWKHYCEKRHLDPVTGKHIDQVISATVGNAVRADKNFHSGKRHGPRPHITRASLLKANEKTA